MKPELSCIIITLNEEKHLPILLESLKKQTYKDFEIIVADYDSKDKTREIAKRYGCIITKGGHYSTGRNNGARIAKGKYLLFLDADSSLPHDFLEVNMREFKKSKKGIGTIEVKPLSKRYSDQVLFKMYDIWSRCMSKFSPHCAGCGLFARKDVFRKIKGFDEKIVFAEDHEFSKRAFKYGLVILPRCIYTSVRRLDKDGRVKFAIKYIYAGIYRLVYKEIDREIIEHGN